MRAIKKTIFAIVTMSALLLSSCASSSSGNNENVKTVPIKKSAAVYFSRVGNTEFADDVDAISSASLNRVGGELKGNAQMIAQWAADEAGCDSFEIVTDKSYPEDYDKTVDLAKDEKSAKERPSLKSSFDNIDDYDTIWLVFPNWWADLPMPVYSFFDKYDFSGKNIYVFVTHEGSGFSSTIKSIKELEPKANVVEALSIRGGSVNDNESSVRDYVKKQLEK
ncbi:flavodoxin [Ruminococcus sp. FC2018]|uniref:flavodoxin n=1 Tax=Ruminococcus sp. FC2018 TaxID=1410617 RepID=UPI00068861C7|nr:flavodoxin [Ruminococcus sp. FC2018]